MKADKKRNRHGVLLGILFIICHAIAGYFSQGLIYKIFTSHKKAEGDFGSSATSAIFRRLKVKTRRFFENVKKIISRQFENSLILNAFSSVSSSLFRISGRTLGIFTLTWSAYVIGISLIKRYSFMMSDAPAIDLWCGIVVLAASVPLLFSDKPLCVLCSKSPIVFSVLTKIFGVPPETMKAGEDYRVGQSIAVIFGIVFGLLSYLIAPLNMILVSFAMITVALILAFPEGGVIISIAIAPFLGLSFAPSRILAAIVLLTAIAYGIKVIRGKRVINIGISELSFMAFMAAIFLAGFAPGDSNTFEHAILCCSLMLIFPLTVNLMKYRRWIKTCALAFIIPAVLISFIGIVQYSLGLAPDGWLDKSLFGGITSRAVSLFNNPNILGVYITMLFPLMLTRILPHHQPKVRILGIMFSAFLAVCTVFTFSRSAWIALVAGGMIFAVMVSPKGILWMIPVSASAVGASLLFPDTVGARIKNFVTMSDSANNYRMSVWNSSWELLSDVFVGGIGMGEEAFKTAFIEYADAGTQYAMHSHSLYMQIAIQTGIIGLILFFVFIFNAVRRCCSSLSIKRSDDFLSSCVKAAAAGACSLLVAGLFDYTWYNYRVFFMFWALIGFACAASNLNDRSYSDIYLGSEDEHTSSVTIPISITSQGFDLAEIEKEVLGYDGREED